MDSWGKLESGIWDGNIIWEGRYFQCLESDFDEDVSGQYCAAYVPLPGGLVSFFREQHYVGVKLIINVMKKYQKLIVSFVSRLIYCPCDFLQFCQYAVFLLREMYGDCQLPVYPVKLKKCLYKFF